MSLFYLAGIMETSVEQIDPACAADNRSRCAARGSCEPPAGSRSRGGGLEIRPRNLSQGWRGNVLFVRGCTPASRSPRAKAAADMLQAIAATEILEGESEDHSKIVAE